MMQLYLKRKFAAAHYLPEHPKCGGMHGHTWLVEVWMEGDVDPQTGMVADFGDIKKVIDFLDHTTLNAVLPLQYLPPTAENLVKYFLEHIPFVYRVRVWESDNAYAEDWSDDEQPLMARIDEEDFNARVQSS